LTSVEFLLNKPLDYISTLVTLQVIIKLVNKNLIGVFDAIKAAWELIQKNLGLFLLLGVGPQVVYTLLALIIFAPLDKNFNPNSPAFFSSLAPLFSGLIILFVLSLILGTLVSILQILLVIKTDRGEPVTLDSMLKDGVKVFFTFLITEVLVGLAVFAGILLLIVPGIIFAVWFFAAIYIVVGENKGAFAAMSESKNLVSGLTWEVLWRFIAGILLLIVVSIVVSIPLAPLTSGLGRGNLLVNLLQSFVNGALSIVGVAYSYTIYKSLKAIKSSQPTPAPEQPVVTQAT